MTVNTNMEEWTIESTIPPLFLGEKGENNAITVSIKIDDDAVISAGDVVYYLDIYDNIDGESTIARTQILSLVSETEITEETDDDGNTTTIETTIYYLQMKPTSDWLGRSGLKTIQVRCEYTDTDNNNVVIKSNVFSGIVKMSVY